MISNGLAREYRFIARIMEEFSGFLKERSEKATRFPSPGAIVQDQEGRMYVYRMNGNQDLLDTMGNGGLRPLHGDWCNYDIVQDSPDP